MASPKNDSVDQHFCLRWNNFQANITTQFETLRNEEDFVDVTFACGGRLLGAHKIVLSACSPYFKLLFKNNPCTHPVIFMRDVEIQQMEALLEFIYSGEVNIAQTELSIFLKTAEALQIRGLTEASYQYKNNEDKIPEVSFQKSDKKTDSHTTSSMIIDQKLEKFKRIQEDIPSKRNCPNDRIDEYPCDVKQEIEHLDVNEADDRSGDYIEPKIEVSNFERDNNIDENLMNLDFDSTPMSFDLNSTASTSQLSMDNCPESSQVSPSFTTHQISSRRQSVDTSIPTIENTNYNTKGTIHSLVRRPCPICGRVYSNHSNLRQHINLIHSPEAMTCPLCQKTFRTKLYLRRHIASYHNESPSRFGLNSENNGWSNNASRDQNRVGRDSNVNSSREVVDNISRDQVNTSRVNVRDSNVNSRREVSVNVSRDHVDVNSESDYVNSTNSNTGVKISDQNHGLGFYGKINNEYLQDGAWCDIDN